jgi:hypothetical protein
LTAPQSDEAYVGLYVLKERGADPKSADFVQFGKDAFPLKPFDTLQARVLTVQADPRTWTDSTRSERSRAAQQWLNAVEKAWDPFFKPENTVGRELAEANARVALLSPADADLRILTVYAPFHGKTGS